MRIIQITDLHINREREMTNFGIDVRSNFLQVIRKTADLAPDHLVLSGDLCYRDGDPEIYTWIRDHLDALEIPYDLISGNHDDPRLMAKVFRREHLLKNGELYFCRKMDQEMVLFLDTTTGAMSEGHLDWLRRQLHNLEGDMIIFMHHPPLLAGVPHMDRKYPLQNAGEVLRIFNEYPFRLNIFTGHYHVEKTIHWRNLSVHITPSCFFQIDMHRPDFQVDHFRIGLREIELLEGQIRHSVIYL